MDFLHTIYFKELDKVSPSALHANTRDNCSEVKNTVSILKEPWSIFEQSELMALYFY